MTLCIVHGEGADMTFADQLRNMGACPEAVEWVGTRTLEQAWATCQRGEWMAWLTHRLQLDSRKAAADIAERVWYQVKPESRLACAWAIDAARRGADAKEMAAAGDACADAAWADARAATWAAAMAASRGDAWAAAWAAASWAAAGVAAWAATQASPCSARDAELAAQADIMRQHFSATQIAEAVQFVTAPRTP